MFRRFCKLFFESSTGRCAILQLPCCPTKQGELLENILQNLRKKWPARSVLCLQNNLPTVRNKGDSNFTHVLRSCFEPHYHNRSGVAPVKIPIRHYDDEADASGCIQFYNEDYMVTKISNPSGKVLGRSDPS